MLLSVLPDHLPGVIHDAVERQCRWVGGWMDRYIDGWMDRWMDGWMDGWMDRKIDRNHRIV